MTRDMTVFPQLFFQQSIEKLDLIASELSNGTLGLNTILQNTVEDIKMVATALDLLPATDFTDDIERVWDDIHTNQRALTPEIKASLLSAIVLLKDRLFDLQPNNNMISLAADTPQHVDQHVPGLGKTNSEQFDSLPAGIVIWEINFKPGLTFLQTGGEPIHLFQALAILGDLAIEVIEDRLPLFSELDPGLCYLSWQLTLKSYAPAEDIEGIFKGIEAQCDIVIAQQKSPSQPQKSASQGPYKALVEAKPDRLDILQVSLTELTSTQLTLSHLAEHFSPKLLPKFDAGLEQLAQHTQAIEDVIRQMRMWPMSIAYSHVQTAVEAHAEALGKSVEFILSGELIEIDKTVLQTLIEPLVQFACNAISHGIESPVLRQQQGKSEIGILQLRCSIEPGQTIIEITDDGRGLDKGELIEKATEQGLAASETDTIEQLIFTAGFSTALAKQAIFNLGGWLDVTSVPGQGTTFTLYIPQKYWVIDGQMIKVAGERYILPLSSVIASFEIEQQQIKYVSGKGELYLFNDEYIPVIQLAQLLERPAHRQPYDRQQLLTVVSVEGKTIGLVIDTLLSQQRTLIKSLATHYQPVTGFSGATVMGDDSVVLVLNMAALMPHYKMPSQRQSYPEYKVLVDD